MISLQYQYLLIMMCDGLMQATYCTISTLELALQCGLAPRPVFPLHSSVT
jgi:hypothetical protein